MPRALFTAFSPAYKGGVPLSILLRTEDAWRESGVRDQTERPFTTAVSGDAMNTERAERIERSNRRDPLHVFSGNDLPECAQADDTQTMTPLISPTPR